ncbi:hypothetical protein SEA_MUSETTA_22 [Microbacterium phage Musetta]|nr:hypothetical protein SEA_LYELL_23 [Microbacterium phage Lyell]AXH50182.1 hypothetical protein SEA_MUSETTA_22 [Microbacterium phage Musetta]QWS69391.1 hypothetical protein SEA_NECROPHOXINUS_25 [Microbacterium phage Necrophoxinus]URM87429.1 hypothetical protein SEA_DUSTYDINO_25 [Microbacterium phage DustyDino]UVK62440.1 hypothetical protein SEA_YUMA_22 [Microbacterium phage Yuma]WMI33896.1 hypothetical protein SEA_ERENYEAGER_21 [Microbacterium phage Erenyeager]
MTLSGFFCILIVVARKKHQREELLMDYDEFENVMEYEDAKREVILEDDGERNEY